MFFDCFIFAVLFKSFLIVFLVMPMYEDVRSSQSSCGQVNLYKDHDLERGSFIHLLKKMEIEILFQKLADMERQGKITMKNEIAGCLRKEGNIIRSNNYSKLLINKQREACKNLKKITMISIK